MDKSFHYLIMINQALFQKKVLNKLLKTELTPGQPKVLDYLRLHDGSMQKDIARGCQIDPATLTGILERMEEKGLVERRTKAGNRRSSYVYLTESGIEQGELVAKTFLEAEEEISSGIDQKEMEKLLDLLYQIYRNMTELED